MILSFDGNTDGCCDEGYTDEIGPEERSGHPNGDDAGDRDGGGQVLHTEEGEGRGETDAAEDLKEVWLAVFAGGQQSEGDDDESRQAGPCNAALEHEDSLSPGAGF